MSRLHYYGLEVGGKAAGRPHKRPQGCLPITKAKDVSGATVARQREYRTAELESIRNAGLMALPLSEL